MKQSSFILSMIIPCEKGPGNDIDIYMQPLIEELKQLWVGVETYDVLKKENFNLRAALLWTINDFPAYANLSGWSTKGRYACPCCAAQTCSKWLYNGKKFSYMGHRRWLDENHRFRYEKNLFDGTEEFRRAPEQTTRYDIWSMLKHMQFSYGKTNQLPNSRAKKKNKEVYDHDVDQLSDDDSDEEDDPNEAELWKKRSIFFELPYWKHNILRHNLDVMHIEKNVCENIIGTILNVDGKSKDNLKSRLDLVDMGIRHELHPQQLANGKTSLPPSIFTMSKKEKEVFCTVLKDIKVPDGYASNISRCVSVKDRRLYSLKSHDYHILMQDLMPVALRNCMSNEVTSCIIELSNIMKVICGKVLMVEELEKLQDRVALTLCNLEKIFPPSFFTIMVHLLVHLPYEAKVGGPVFYRWMYPNERFLCKLKSYCRNKCYPEGSIVEGYLAEECLTFYSRYMEDVETRFNRSNRNDVCSSNNSAETYLFGSYGEPLGKVEIAQLDDKSWVQAHRYVLFHHNSLDSLRTEYKEELQSRVRSRRLHQQEIQKLFTETFHEWLGRTVWNRREVSEEVKWLSQGPDRIVKRYNAFLINGFRFHTKSRERLRRTQNCGVVVTSSITSYASARDNHPVEGDVEYFGVLTDIIELDYYGRGKVVLFRCDWADVNTTRGIKRDQFGFTVVNFSRLIHTGQQLMDEPYVFSSQVKQVFYCHDPMNKGWYVVLRNTPRDLIDIGDGNSDDIERRSKTLPFAAQNLDGTSTSSSSQFQWAREDMDVDFNEN
ncbi:hypothetical protein HRI_000049700 [Hibiscus trionum]|uniref:Uncharacterized protein n=1 Tax=Hibiscus trionum TaxID=183268 RepID=A0A9W7GQD0_HIBTR|nr:hypothetical protein HRI_000049700 [Hibiscus trionum]